MSGSSKKAGPPRDGRGQKLSGSGVHVPTPSTLSLLVERPDHNSRVGYIVVPQFPSADPRHGKTTPEGAAGVYRVTFVLSVPGKNVFRERVELGKAPLEGDSLLVLPPKSNALKVSLTHSGADIGFIALNANAHNRLANAVMRVNAQSLQEAERTAHDVIAGFLSYLSYANDVAVDITGYEVLEENTGTLKGVFGMIGKAKMASMTSESSSPVSDDDYKRLFSAYREGMNATNVFYQALSFYKAIEGCQRLRKEKNRRASAPGSARSTPPLNMPQNLDEIPIHDEQVRGFFRPFLGKKLTYVVDQLRPLIRNAIAHLDPSKDVLDIDRYEDIAKCEQSIPVLRYMARQFIAAELNNP